MQLPLIFSGITVRSNLRNFAIVALVRISNSGFIVRTCYRAVHTCNTGPSPERENVFCAVDKKFCAVFQIFSYVLLIESQQPNL